MYKYFKKIDNPEDISSWESKYTGKRMYVEFNGSCLKQDKITFHDGKTAMPKMLKQQC